ncbi:hypothetical protein AAW14_00730 [Streptomyces hygroscopicus]|uniref:hypothetical protein n=1 Tax=Streptomyces hygroscopicus TaxID=1912 RepID=UPI00223FE202|nr:hypothetical protein [Streptomyces hygroscopicus]MCW7940615.1 hypothetical protein [Streptomyces hygroscopicus]
MTLVVHEHKRLGRGIELAMLAEELKASDVGLEFLTGERKGSHEPSGIVFTALAARSGCFAAITITPFAGRKRLGAAPPADLAAAGAAPNSSRQFKA